MRDKKRGRPPKPKAAPVTRKDIAENTKFWLSLQTLASNPITKQKELLSQLDLMTIKMINKAKHGNVNAYTALMDRAYGKPKQYSESNVTNKTIVAISWADGNALPQGAMPIPEPTGEEIEYEPVDLPDEEVKEFVKQTERNQ